jgi:serine phosphatase RsbU (regulator of sigma subunit)
MDIQALVSPVLPDSRPDAGCIELAVERRSARSGRLRGGDVVDVYRGPDGSASVLVADLSSKGARSAAHVDLLLAAYRQAARTERSPSGAMAALNRLRFGSPDDCLEAFAAVFIARVDGATQTLRYASAGHDTALIVRDRKHRHLAQTGPVIGVIPDAAYGEYLEEFDVGDVLLAATDGFTECRRHCVPSQQLGTSGILQALRARARHSPKTACAAIGTFADAFTGSEYRDDATLVAVSRRSSNPRRSSIPRDRAFTARQPAQTGSQDQL